MTPHFFSLRCFFTVCFLPVTLELYVVLGIVYPKLKVLSSFIYPQVVPSLHEFLSLNIKDHLKNEKNTMQVTGDH